MTQKRHVSAGEIARDVAIASEYFSGVAGVRAVWLFGSAAKGRTLDWRSDLDVAVEGLPRHHLERVWSELYTRLNLPIDLVRWEDASELLRQEIRRWGKLLYES